MPVFGTMPVRSGAQPSVTGLIRTAGVDGAVKPSGTVAPKKTAYTADGSAVEIDVGMPTSNYDPNVGYAGTHYFNAPPPRTTIEQATAPQAFANVAQTQAETAQMMPSVAPLAGNAQGSMVTQGAYEGQAQTQLEATLEQQAAAGNVAAQKELLQQRATLSDETFAKRLAALSAMGGGGTSEPTTTAPAFDEAAARATAFGRAKDQAGQTALASLQALHDVMAGRGMAGSTVEGDATAEIIGGAGNDVNHATDNQLIADLDRAAQISDREASLGVTRRGQDMSQQQSLMALLNASGSLY